MMAIKTVESVMDRPRHYRVSMRSLNGSHLTVFVGRISALRAHPKNLRSRLDGVGDLVVLHIS
jgi:hypothetical protein